MIRLADYKGPHEDSAREGVRSGHTLGLLTSDGLYYLVPDTQDAALRDALDSFVGKSVEIFGPAGSSGRSAVVRVQQISAAR